MQNFQWVFLMVKLGDEKHFGQQISFVEAKVNLGGVKNFGVLGRCEGQLRTRMKHVSPSATRNNPRLAAKGLTTTPELVKLFFFVFRKFELMSTGHDVRLTFFKLFFVLVYFDKSQVLCIIITLPW